MIQAAKDELELDSVIVIPTAIPPHKHQKELATAEHRLKMCRLALADLPWVVVSDIEIRRGGNSYTVDTLTQLEGEMPNSQFFLVVGGDMLLGFKGWWRWKDILKMATLCVAPREKTQIPQLCAKAQQFTLIGNGCRVMNTPVLEISSTEIREQLKGDTLPTLLSPEVADYCRFYGLYSQE